ncbi:hypothetical protein ACVWY3_000461 [Bradyrhizobium sp. USDA 4486]
MGWNNIASDRTDNPVSVNNFIRVGYRLRHSWVARPPPNMRSTLGRSAKSLLAEMASLNNGSGFPVKRKAALSTLMRARQLGGCRALFAY